MTQQGLTPEELAAESAVALPDKEVVSILDLNVDVDVFIDAASPIDLAAAAQLNVAAPIDASAAANVLSEGSGAQAENFQTGSVGQVLVADAIATSDQSSDITQGDEADGDPAPAPDDGGTVAVGDLGTLEGPLLNVDVNVDLDADLAAPIAGAVAANANVAAPISASVAANVGAIDSDAIAYTDQDFSITQELRGTAEANASQDSTIGQGTSQPDSGTTAGNTSGESASGGSTGGDSSSGTSGSGSGSGSSSGGTSSGSAG
ncbi:peptidoglycan-binding protein [Mycobacterium deserti]|uniref:Peptidoglycan-binding protein n=1 Tax=Mycobacterium deserti TaxID=2978347 RepID=A0ABT2MHP4_9MYCO|nr:peptidoglycan-binding protein [Mycobacterium deserti]MCT7661808.1 peptidoglycan-binding protein [Mycobacterium deserti]